MRKNLLLRMTTLLLAWVHTFPAIKHLGIWWRDPSLGEAWKGFGGALAVALYLLPPSWHARGLAALWSRRRGVLVAAGWALAVAHLVPAADHVPRFLADPSWGDLWRGFGSSLAAVWFVLPVPAQARALVGARALSARVAGALFGEPLAEAERAV